MPVITLARRLKLHEAARVSRLSISFILLLTIFLFSFFSSPLLHSAVHGRSSSTSISSGRAACLSTRKKDKCNFSEGQWVYDREREPLYGDTCPFQRNAWNCGKNKRPGLDNINRWKWVPLHCDLPAMDPSNFLASIRNMNVGFVGDSLNENLLVSLLCILASADPSARRWKKRKAWRGAYFPKYNVTVGYHRAVLLADYHEWTAKKLPGPLEKLGFKKGFRVNVDIPAGDWINVTDFYDIVIFNTGHWWGRDKFPQDNPLLFHKDGEPILPPLDLREGLKVVLQHMVSYAERTIPLRVLKIWRTQSPRHFEGGDWNQNGSCLSEMLLNDHQVDEWFGLGRGGVNREAREVNAIISHALEGGSFQLWDVSHLSEYRRDAHPAVWLGQKDAHVRWGQDCMHWCLPGLPDTWVHILFGIVRAHLDSKQDC